MPAPVVVHPSATQISDKLFIAPQLPQPRPDGLAGIEQRRRRHRPQRRPHPLRQIHDGLARPGMGQLHHHLPGGHDLARLRQRVHDIPSSSASRSE